MKRKVIQIANSTVLVSLPRKWVIENNIKKGDEVEITEKGKSILIGSEGKPENITVEVDYEKLEPLMPKWIYSLYKKGIDTVIVKIKSPEQVLHIQEALKYTIGFEIFEHGANTCTIKSVSSNIEGFDQILRRTFNLLISLADETVNALESGDKGQIANAIELETVNDRYTTMCRRILNKQGSETLIGPLYVVVDNIEKIADYYMNILKEIHPSQNKKVNTAMLKETNDLLKEFYECYYKYNVKQSAEIMQNYKKMVEQYRRKINSSNPDERIMAHFANNIIDLIRSGIGQVNLMKLG